MIQILKDKGGKTPHLALTHNELQGGAANKRNASLLMKSDTSITETIVKALEKILGTDIEKEDVEKAAFYNQLRRQLEVAVREKYAEDDEWCYVEDFNDNVVVFCNSEGIFSSTYSVTDMGVELADMASPVTAVISYEPSQGKMLLSEDAEDKLEEGVYGLVVKSLSNPETISHFEKVFKSVEERKNALKEQIEKAVADAVAPLQEIIKSQKEQLEQFEKAAKDAVQKSRKEALQKAVGDVKAEELMSVVADMNDAGFDVILKSLTTAVEQEQKSEMFVEKGANGSAEVKETEDPTLAILKAKYSK